MGRSGTKGPRRGFENLEFKRAVLSFLKEKCPAEFDEAGDLPVTGGLKLIRAFILRKQTAEEGLPAPATA